MLAQRGKTAGGYSELDYKQPEKKLPDRPGLQRGELKSSLFQMGGAWRAPLGDFEERPEGKPFFYVGGAGIRGRDISGKKIQVTSRHGN